MELSCFGSGFSAAREGFVLFQARPGTLRPVCAETGVQTRVSGRSG
jgi:hypothetical protein